MSRLYDLREAAEALDTSEGTVCMLVNRDEIRYIPSGVNCNSPVFREEDLLNYMLSKENK